MEGKIERGSNQTGINEKIEGWKRGYKYNDNPEVASLIDQLNVHIRRFGEGGIALTTLLTHEGQAEAGDAFLQLPVGMPDGAVEQARAIVRKIEEKMNAEAK